MRAIPLQLLTWGTAAAAITSAVWLSSTVNGTLVCSTGFDASTPVFDLDTTLPAEATRAGPVAAPMSGSSGSS